MDVKMYLSLLGDSAAQLHTLVKGLNATLKELKAKLRAPSVTTDAEACPLLDGVVELSDRVSTAAAVLKERIQALKSKCEAGHDTSQATP